MPHPAPFRGFLVMVAVLAALLGLVVRSSALLGVGLALTLALVQAFVRARRGLAGLEARRELLGSAFEEDMVSVAMVLENHSTREARLVLLTEAFSAGVSDRQVFLEPGPLPARSRRRLVYRLFCSPQWGAYSVGPLTFGAWDPMGLVHAERRVGLVDPLVIYPRFHDIAGLRRVGGRRAFAPEEVSAARAGQSSLYLGVREYAAGDDVRSIHWPATARRGTPMIREREVDLVPCFTLVIDLHQGGRAGTGRKSSLEYLVRIGASLLWSAVRRGDAVQVVGEGARPLFVPPGQSEAHLAAALFALIGARQDGRKELLAVLEQYRPLLPAGSTLALLGSTTDIDLDALAAALEALRVNAVRPLLICVDSHSFVPIERIGTSRAQAQARRAALLEFLRSAAVPGTVLGADQDLAEELPRPDLFEGVP